MLQKRLKAFRNKGHKALMKEINQLHKRTCFALLKVKEMKHSKRKKAQMALMFLTEKRDKSVEWYTTGNKQENGYLERTQQAQPPH
jgi:hypothetical protein